MKSFFERAWFDRLARGVPVLLTAGLAVLSSGCEKGEAAAHASTAPRAVSVTVAPIDTRDVERSVEVVGTLHGWEDVSVGAKKGGRVVRVLHDMGDQVKPGEKLVELDTTDARLALFQAKSKYMAELTKLGITSEQAEAALKKFGVTEELINGPDATRLIELAPPIVQAGVLVEKAQNSLTRQRNLHQRGAGTMEELQNAETDFKSAKAARDNAVATARNIIAMAIASKIAIDAAEQTLTDMTIVAPEPKMLPSGFDRSKLAYGLARRSVSEGQMLKDGEPVMELVIEHPLRLWTNVAERYSSAVKVGQPARITVTSHPDAVFEGTVARINPRVDPASRTFQVEAIVPNREGKLRPGGFAKGSIVIEHRGKARVVPMEAVVRFAGVTKLFLVVGEKVKSVNVETGLEGANWIEVIGDLPETGEVVTTGHSQLAEETAIAIRPSEKPTPAAPVAPRASAE